MKWIYRIIRDHYFYKWLRTKNKAYLNKYMKYADLGREKVCT